MKANPRDFLINTDYEMDKIVYAAKGELYKPYPYLKCNLSYPPLLFGVASFDSDFNGVMTIPYNEYDENDNSVVSIALDFYPSDKEVRMYYYDHGLPAEDKRDLYYMLFAFEPSGQRAKAPKTGGKARSLILDTDYNYCKLFKKGVVESHDETIIEHNFGYVPFVLAWTVYYYPSAPIPYYSIDLFTVSQEDRDDTTTSFIQVTDKNVLVKNVGTSGQIHYRIYYDEA